MNILVTGSNGLVGRELCATLEQSGHSVIRAVRRSTVAWELGVGNINGQTNWARVLTNPIDTVVHLAARVHVMCAESENTATMYQEVNTEGTLNLARQCAAKGVKRFVFLSTVKVMGEGKDQPYRSDAPVIPAGPYAVSKWMAEQGLLEITSQTGMEIVILRPPLVYGPGVGANFLQLLKAIDSGLPLPLGAIQNKRSLVYLGNLVDAIGVCLIHPAAAGKTYLVSDSDDVSTPELVRRIAIALGRPARLLPVPESWMRFVGKLLYKEAAIERLINSLTLESQPIKEELGWFPPYSMQAGLVATTEWYHMTKST